MDYKITLSIILIPLVLSTSAPNLPSIGLGQEFELRIGIDSCIVNSSADWVLIINAKNYYIESEDIEVNLIIIRLGDEVEGAMDKLSMYTCCSITYTNNTIVYDPHNYLNLLASLNEYLIKRVSKGDVFYALTWKPFVFKKHGFNIWHPRLSEKEYVRYVVKVNLGINERRNNTWLLRNFIAYFPINMYGKSIILPAIPFPYNCTRIGVFLYGNWSITIGHIGDKGFVNLTYIGRKPLRVKYLLYPFISHLEVVKIYDNGKSTVIRKLGYYIYNKTELIYPGTSDSMEFKVEHNVTLIYVRGKLPDSSIIKLYLPLKGKLRTFKYLYFKKPWVMGCIGDWVIYVKRDYIIPCNIEPEVHVILARVNETPVKIQYFIAIPYVAVDIYYLNGSIALTHRLPPGAIITRTIGREILCNFTWKPSILFEPSRTILDPGQYIMHIKLWVDEIIDKNYHRFKTIEYNKKHILTVASEDKHIHVHEYTSTLYAGPWILKLTYIEKSLQINVNLTYIGSTALTLGHEVTIKLHIYYPEESEILTLKFNRPNIEPGEILLRNITLSNEPILIVLSSNNLPKYGGITLYLPILLKVKTREVPINIVTELNVSSSLTTTLYKVEGFNATSILIALMLIVILAPTLVAIYMLRIRTKRE